MNCLIYFNNLKLWLLKISSLFSKELINPDNTLNVMQIIGLALIGVIIPIAIAVFQKKDSFEKLDKYVFLDFIIKSKWFISYIGIIYIPLFLWDILPPEYRLLEAMIWLIGICFVLKTIADSYYWIKGNANIPRLKYLKKLSNKEEMEIVWESIWSKSKLHFKEEFDFFKIFAFKIDKLLKKSWNNKKVLSKLLLDYLNNIQKRSTFLISNSTSKILDWNALMWRKENTQLKDNKKERIRYFEISNPIDRITDKMIERNLIEGMDYALFDILKKFVNQEEKQPQYINRFFNIFYRIFFDNFGKLIKQSSAWEDYFPDEWKVTKKNISDSSNFISNKTLNGFIKWAQNRIMSSKKEYDKELDEAVTGLFPEVDLLLFSKILIFTLSFHSPDNWCRSIIGKSWNFGGYKFVGVFSGKDENSIKSRREKELEDTLDLTLIIFKDIFTEEALKNFIIELENLTDLTNTSMEHKRDSLLAIFKKLIDFLNRHSKQ